MSYQYEQFDTALRLLNGRLDIAASPNFNLVFVVEPLWSQLSWSCEPPEMLMSSLWQTTMAS